jgi:hypothetical protein
MRKKKLHRWFLDGPQADSYVRVNAEGPGDLNIKIADCNRAVTLEFSFGPWDGRTRAQARRKLEKLQRALDLIAAEIER